MAHYLAEKMTDIDSAGVEAKAQAQRECFETILLLWDYRACFPDGMRPFNSLEPIFNALEHINPNKAAPSFFINENRDNSPPKEIEQTIELITSLDAAVRIMISFLVRESILHATDKSTLDWLGAIGGIAKSDEARILLKFIPGLDESDPVQGQNEKRKNELSEHVDRLEAFENLSREIKAVLEAELERLM